MFSPYKRPHGIDLSDAMLRIAEVDQAKDGIHMYGFSQIALPPGYIVEGEIVEHEKVLEKIKELYGSVTGKIHSPFVVLSVPERKTFTKVITIDTLPKEQLTEAVQWEAEQHFPISLEEVYVSWSLIQETREKQNILLSATNKSTLDQYIDILHEVHKTVIIAEPESIAIQRVLMQDKKQPTLILDLGQSKTTVSIVIEGITRYSSTTSFAGTTLTNLIMKQLSLSQKQAERAKILFGLDPARSKGVVQKILNPAFETFIDYCKEILEYYKTHFEKLPMINRIVLCGNGSQIEGIQEYLSEIFKVPVEVPKIPLIKNSVLAKFPIEQQSSFSTVFGLALRGSVQKPFSI